MELSKLSRSEDCSTVETCDGLVTFGDFGDSVREGEFRFSPRSLHAPNEIVILSRVLRSSISVFTSGESHASGKYGLRLKADQLL
jgi:hypothetical protein